MKKTSPSGGDSVEFSAVVLSPESWTDLVSLFGEKGACGGCWCMTWRLPQSVYHETKGDGNKKLLRQLVKKAEPLGVIGYDGNKPIAWCSVSPQPTLLKHKNSRILSVTDFPEKWCIVCLYILPAYRRRGISVFMIKAASEYAFANGAKIVEAYPVIPQSTKMPDVFAWTGVWKAFKNAGFKVVEQPSPGKYIMTKHKC